MHRLENFLQKLMALLLMKQNFINITMPVYNFIEYSDNYSDTSGRLWGFKKNEIGNNANVTDDDNVPSFKYKANLIGNTKTDVTRKGVKVSVPQEHLSNFWRSLEIPLINCKAQLLLKWIENFLLPTAVNPNKATFEITDVNFMFHQAKDLKRSIFWNKYKVIDNTVVEIAGANVEKYLRELFDSSYQGVKRLFVLAYDNKEGNNQVSIDSFKNYFLS